MCALKLISTAVPKVTDKTFKRKYIALGRIVTHWKDIMGEKMAAYAQPLKIHYRKPKKPGDKPEATLEIAASSAHASLLIMQKGLLLERINQIFGERWVSDIKFVHTPANNGEKPKKQTKPLTEDEKNSLSQMLEMVEDPAIRERLERMGASLFQDLKS
ncbi:MAG: DciA family protein [Alphaproteobacteria bacterium]|nr:DciA family protein [Alphaproteobacteria bacterium]